MGVEIRGLNRLKGKLGKVSGSAQKGVEHAVYEITQEVSGRASSNLQSSVKHGTGELAGSVKDEVTTNSNGNYVGRVFSDKSTAMYREFGTGPNGEKSPKDLPPGVTPVYTQKAWFFPVSSSIEDLTALYGIPKIEIQGVEFYKTSGQPARPWLYPALKYVEENMAEDILKRNVQEAIRKGLR